MQITELVARTICFPACRIPRQQYSPINENMAINIANTAPKPLGAKAAAILILKPLTSAYE